MMSSEMRSPSPTPTTTITSEQQDTGASQESAVGQKRKSPPASNDVEADATSKRPRTDAEKTDVQDKGLEDTIYDDPPHHNVKEPSKPDLYDRRKTFTQEEKKRGKRLFGGLLNTLSQKTTSTQQRKRQEIERRQQERAQKEKSEDDKRKTEKLAKLKRIREAEQIKYDERVMRVRHRNMLAIANSLKTRSTPPIHYVPYQLTRDQEDEIDDQVHDARVTIRNEVEEFKRRATRRLKELGFDLGPERSKPLESGGGDNKKTDVPSAPFPSSSDPLPPLEPADTTTQLSAEKPVTGPKSAVEAHGKEHPDDNGDVVLEAEEDTVIY